MSLSSVDFFQKWLNDCMVEIIRYIIHTDDEYSSDSDDVRAACEDIYKIRNLLSCLVSCLASSCSGTGQHSCVVKRSGMGAHAI